MAQRSSSVLRVLAAGIVFSGLVCSCTRTQPDPGRAVEADPSPRESARVDAGSTLAPPPAPLDSFDWSMHEFEALGVRASFITGVEVRKFEFEGTRRVAQVHPTFSLAVWRGPDADAEHRAFTIAETVSELPAEPASLCGVEGVRQVFIHNPKPGSGWQSSPEGPVHAETAKTRTVRVTVTATIDGEPLRAEYVVDADQRGRLAGVEARFFDELRCL